MSMFLDIPSPAILTPSGLPSVDIVKAVPVIMVMLVVNADGSWIIIDASSSCTANPGISEATQTYGSVLGTAVIVADLFFVPSALITSLDSSTATFVELCRK